MTSLNVTGSTAIQELRCYYNTPLQTITGLGGCTALTYFDCEDCSITNLSALQNANNIASILARNNKLTSFTVSGKSHLTYLRLSGNTSLATVHCYTNALTTLDVTGCTSLSILGCYENPSLSKITGLDDCSNLTQLFAYNCAFNSLDLSNKTKLSKLSCYANRLTSLNVTGCTALTNLLCGDNSNLTAITGLDNCRAITTLNCENCAITNLNATSLMPNITTLAAANNKLTSLSLYNKTNLKTLIVSNNTTLTSLVCFYNNLTTLNVTGCTALSDLRCYNNDNLTAITGLASCSELEYLDCEDCALNTLNGLQNKTKLRTIMARNNNLTQLIVSGCTSLTYIKCYSNNINGANMTLLVNSLPQRTADEPGSLYVLYNTDEGNTMNNDQIATATSKYWLPKRYNGTTWETFTVSLQGDVNSDGVVNITDVTVLINAVMNENFSGINSANADMNNDGIINITDVTMLINTVSNS